jgi:hypothetical protein
VWLPATTTAAVVLIVGAVSDAIWVAIIGGVFLVASQLLTVWLNNNLDRRRREGTFEDRRHPSRDRDRRRRGADREPLDRE